MGRETDRQRQRNRDRDRETETEREALSATKFMLRRREGGGGTKKSCYKKIKHRNKKLSKTNQ